jgi:hypothetical protein
MINDIFVVITIYFTTCHLWQCIILFYYLPFAVVHHIICSKKIKFSAAITYGQSKHPKHYEKEKKCKLDNDDYSCVLCQSCTEETAFHLFIQCPFSTRCWQPIGIRHNMGHKPRLLPNADCSKTTVWQTICYGNLHHSSMAHLETEKCTPSSKNSSRRHNIGGLSSFSKHSSRCTDSTSPLKTV